MLSTDVNQIKIASEDGMNELALSSLSELKTGLNALGETCSSCHDKDTKNYPNQQINETIAKLEQSLLTGTLKEQGQGLGTLAVLACANCHGTHRISYDNRQMLVNKRGWLELIKH